jgi:hypothetical protein
MIRPSHPLRCDHPNNIWQVQIMRLLIIQCSSYSRNFNPLKSKKSKYSPQQPVLKHPCYTVFPTIYFFLHPHKTVKFIVSYILIFACLCKRTRCRILNWMVSILSRIYYTVNSSWMQFWHPLVCESLLFLTDTVEDIFAYVMLMR